MPALDGMNICAGADGSLVDSADPNAPVLIVPAGAINPEYFNVLRAASIAQVAIKCQLDTLGGLIEVAEQLGLDDFVPALTAAQSACHVARRIAIEGVENVRKDNPQ